MNFKLLRFLVSSLFLLTGCMPKDSFSYIDGAIVRGETTEKRLALVFTGDEFGDGGQQIVSTLSKNKVLGSFFLTGKFYRNPQFETLIQKLVLDGHYMGAHSDQHLLYCDWENRDSLLVSKNQFQKDLASNYLVMESFGIHRENATIFLPPYEWYNDSIAAWTEALGLRLINLTFGTLSHTDYTLPTSAGYRSSQEILESILTYETSSANGLNGFILLSHIGSSPERTDKFYLQLDHLIRELKTRGYTLTRIDKLLSVNIL